MDRLADVELRLIMHNVDAQSLLRFARCSRLLLHAADARHTWKHTPIALSSAAFTDRGLAVCSPLIRHAPVVLRIAPCKRSFPVVEMLAALARAQIRLYELDASSGAKISSKQWRMMIEHRACRQLRVVRMNYALPLELDADFFRAFTALPHLHTAALSPSIHAGDHTVWSFSGARSLTCLGLTSHHGHSTCIFPRLQGQVRSLRRLELFCVSLDAPKEFRRCCRELDSLEELSVTLQPAIGGQAFNTIPSTLLAKAFTALTRLHRMEFINPLNVDRWLVELRHAPALRSLVISPCVTLHIAHQWQRYAPNVPAHDVVIALLTELPRLHCTMHLRPKADVHFGPDRGNPGPIPVEGTATKEQQQHYVAPLIAAFPDRFTALFDE